MTQAEINILIRSRAREARQVFQAVARDLNMISKAGANAGAVLDGLAKASNGYRASLGGSSAAAASLAKNLALSNKATATLTKSIQASSRATATGTRGFEAYGRAAQYAAPQVANLATATDRLTASLHRNRAAADSAATGLRNYAAAAKAASTASAASNAASATAGTALVRQGQAQQRATATSRNLARSWYETGAATRVASERMDQATRSIGANTRALQGSQQRAIGAGNAAATAAASTAAMGAAGARAGRNWGAFNDRLDANSTALRKAGSQMQWTGRQLTAMFTIPTLLATGFGVKWAMDQERAFTRMAKVYDGAVSDIDQNLEQSGVQFSGSKFDQFFTALSEKMGQTKTEVTEIGAYWAQVGAQGRNLAEATKLTTEFMVVGDQDAIKSAQDLISIQAQYKISIAELTEVIQDLNAIENATAVSMKDLADGFTRTAAVAREAGVDARHLGAFLAALVPAAGTAAVSANGLKSIFTRLMVPTKEASAQLANLGIITDDPNWINKNAVERLQILGQRMEGLSQQQKFDLAKPFAGLYQINKFVALMDDLASTQGYYQKALDATADSAKSYAVYQRELNRVLESNPQKFKQVGVILQNALVKIITPLIPHILYLAQGLAKLMKAFSELSPVTQKWIVLGALALAAVGPLAMILGSFMILFGVVGRTLALVGRALVFLLPLMGKLGGKFGVMKLMARGAAVELAALARTLALVFTTAAGGGAIAHVGGWFSSMIVAAVAWAGRMWAIIVGLFGRIAPYIIRVVAPRIAAAFGYAVAGISGPIGWAIAAALTLIALFPKQTWNLLKGFGRMWWRAFSGAIEAVKAGIRAIMDIVLEGVVWTVNQLQKMALQGVPLLARPFVLGVKIAGAALAALPDIVARVFRAVIQTIVNAAKAIYNAFSYINPFARHSPSLVENVTAGMAIVKDEFSSMADSVSADTQRAYSAISKFGGATAGLTARATGIDTDKKRESIRTADPDGTALPAYDELSAELGPLNARLSQLSDEIKSQKSYIDSLNKEIDAFQDRIDAADKAIDSMNDSLDLMRTTSEMLSDALENAKTQLEYYANAPIKGMRAMSDAIFENEMAQKRLQLEIMKLEDAGESIDAVKDKFAQLQGQIEDLSAKREELRLAGAGSDILGVYDQMIKDLQAQQGETASAGVSKIEKAQKELERLQREGERLDLENALKFDPLTRQIDQMVNSTKELSFDEITRGIRTNQAAVEGLTVAYDASNAAIEVQEAVIKAAEAARDAMNDQLQAQQDNLEKEQEKLQGIEDSHSKVEEAIEAVQKAMDDLSTSADTVNQYLEEQARLAEEAARAAEELAKKQGKLSDEEQAALDFQNAGLGDFEVPGGENFDLSKLMGENANFDDLTQQLSDDVAKAFENIDLMAPVKNMFTRFGNSIKEQAGNVGNWFVDLGTGIGNWFMELPNNIGGWMSGVGSAVGGFFSRLWPEYIWPALQSVPGLIGDFFTTMPGLIASAVAYSMGYIAGMVISAFMASFDFGTKLVGWVTDAFVYVVDKGTDILAAFGTWLTGIAVQVVHWLGDLGPKIADWVRGAFQYVSDNWLDIAKLLVDKFGSLPQAIITILAGLGSLLWDALKAAFDWLINEWPKLAREIADGLYIGLLDALEGIGDWVKEHIVDPFLQGFKDAMGINSPSTVFAEFGLNIIQGLWNGILGAKDWLVNKVKEMAKDYVVNPFKEALGINSPSKVFEAFGRNVGDGLALGLGAGADAAGLATADLIGSVLAASSDLASAEGPTAPLNPMLAPPTSEELSSLATGLLGVRQTYDAAYAAISAANLATTEDMYAALGASTDVYAADTVADYSNLGATLLADQGAFGVALVGANDAMLSQLSGSWERGRNAVTDATTAMSDDGTTAFQSLADNMATIMNDQIAPMFDSFDPMLSTVSGWFGSAVDNIGTIWSGIKEPVAVPSRFIVNDVYNNGIKVAWNNVSGWLGLTNLPDAVAAFATGGYVDRHSLVNPNTPRDITRGGRLSGSISGDKTLFAGQGGEVVWSRSAVERAGGPAVVMQAHNALLAGKSAEGMGAILGIVPGFAGGGALPGKVIDAQGMARQTFHGQEYDYGASGPNSFDCSGAWSYVYSYLTDQLPYYVRKFTTENNFGALGWDRGLNGAVTIGVHNGGGGILSHMAGTLGGINLESGGSHNSSIFGGPAAGSDNPQFENQYTLREIGGVFSSGGMGGGSAPSMLDLVTAEFKRVMDPIKDTWPYMPGEIAKLDPAAYQKNYDSVGNFLFGKAGEYDAAHPPMGNTPYNGAGVEQYRALVQKILAAKGYPLSSDEAVLRRMQKESGGNPNAINDYDSNALAGYPTKGLMQMRDDTFLAHMDAGYGNIWAAEDNIRSSMNYAKSEYGSLEAAYNRPGGYDSGGKLPPTPGGYGTYYNHTGTVENVLTDPQWGWMMDIADGASKFSAKTIETGVIDAIHTVYGNTPSKDAAEMQAAAIQSANSEWVPLIYDASQAQVKASNATANAAEKTKSAIDNFAEAGKDFATQVSKLSEFMIALSKAAQNPNSFGAWAPVINAAAGVIETLPEMEPTYVSWAGTRQEVTEEMKRQKIANDAANAGKGLYNIGKSVLPGILKHTAIIGSAIEQIVVSQGPIVGAALAMMPVNPVGAAIMLIPVILQSIFTILPLIINAIVDIVPTLLKAILKFTQSFMPDSVYSYDSYEAASEAVAANEAAIKAGASAPYFVKPERAINQTNAPTTINVYVAKVEAKDSGSAKQFVDDLETMGG